MKRVASVILCVCLGAACGGGPSGDDAPSENGPSWDRPQGVSDRVASIEGLSGPEAVRYDPDQDVWFIANFGPGNGDDRDADGFVTRVDAETGRVTDLRFIEGTADQPLHMPRGMHITGDTLWVADVDGVHGFDRRTGNALAFYDFRAFEPGFLNDIAVGADGGTLYVTDTGRSSLFSVEAGVVTEILADSALGSPNGITWDGARSGFVLVPWTPGHPARLWRPGEAAAQALGPTTPGRLDGVEAIDRRLLVASQTDSTLHLMDAGGFRSVIRVDGAPADIGVDTRRRRVAVPYIALDRVDIWQLPPE